MTVTIANLDNDRAYANVLSDIVALIEATMKQQYADVTDPPAGVQQRSTTDPVTGDSMVYNATSELWVPKKVLADIDGVTYCGGATISTASTTTTEITGLKLSVTLDAGQAVLLGAQISFSAAQADDQVVFSLMRDSTAIGNLAVAQPHLSTTNGQSDTIALVYFDAPGAGTFDYYVGWYNTAARNIYCKRGSLVRLVLRES